MRRCIWNRLGLCFVLAGTLLASGCINEAGNEHRYRVFHVKPEQLADARQKRLPYIINRRGHIQTIQPIDFYTRQWGRVRLKRNFVSDGSSLPFDDDLGSNMAALLHDALYRGAPELTFPHGYPGRWTRAQADAAYCVQLRRQGATERLAKVNCKGVNILGVSQGVWRYHRPRRQAYWQQQEHPQRKSDIR
ncbi:MAG: hypothetical protein ABJH63_05870 [Rhizobiaceae bacterium]